MGIGKHGFYFSSHVRSIPSGTGEVAQQLRALAALTEDPGSVQHQVVACSDP